MWSRPAPTRQPVSLRDAGPLEDLAIHLQVARLVRELEQAALLKGHRQRGRGLEPQGRVRDRDRDI